MSQLGKIKAFSLSAPSSSSGTPAAATAAAILSAANKVMDKKQLEKQKKLADEEAAAQAYQEFVETFEEAPKQGKLFIRGQVINPGGSLASDESSTLSAGQSSSSGKYYKANKFQELESKKRVVVVGIIIGGDGKVASTPEPLFAKSDKPPKKKGEVKKKTNLELFKEELKQIQEEREERHRLKNQMKESGVKLPSVKSSSSSSSSQQSSSALELSPLLSSSSAAEVGVRLADEYRLPGMGSYDTGDPNTTNIYLGNLNPKMTEPQLCQLFGKYGPLASVKIMWPRSDEERSRNRNCGFVAFMNRLNGERALKALNGREVMDYEMKLGWGKAVPIPPHPVYIPPALMELTMPPPQSGLPFNAQPDPSEPIGRDKWHDNKENLEKVMYNSVVKVVVPTDRTLLCLIHRMVEFVVREGPMFEAMIMNREINNPTFRFLFDNQSPAHVYYRWRLFSVLQGEHPSKWRTEEFRMFDGGSLWRPPPLNPWDQGMPDELIESSPPRPSLASASTASAERAERSAERTKHRRSESKRESSSSSSTTTRHESRRGMLSESQRDRLEDMLRNMIPERSKIADTMIYCIDHSESAAEIVDCIAESLAIEETPLYKKIARLYLISDILHNCSVKVSNVSFFRKGFQSRLVDIFHDLRDTYAEIDGRLKAEQFKQRVMSCFRAWEEQAIYSPDFLIKLQNIFLGLVQRHSSLASDDPSSRKDNAADDDDVDGVPFIGGGGDQDIDGVPLDIDGEPMVSTSVSASDSSALPKFKPSKWETIDPELVEAQAMTTSKWESLEPTNDDDGDDDDIDGKPFDPSPNHSCGDGDDSGSRGSQFLASLKHELTTTTTSSTPTSTATSGDNSSKRQKLREIEVKVLRYQDELESGKRSRKSSTGLSVQQLVEEYRRKLLKRANDDDMFDESYTTRDYTTPSAAAAAITTSHSPRTTSRRRSRSRSRSRSPRRHSRDSSASSSSHHHLHHRDHSHHRSRSPTGLSSSLSSSRRKRLSPQSPHKRRK
ncbi:LOW QUALITY PROTEIN: U2 snRNP-associated SURP motif-containing protein-like [Oppia nitens]|uniref:LOW QUALITY PROTEIN: U2 snRNP-associated SURP motif-containing protein-like n=1 Tax=Oppia nitens TaxID=1686743 RepID=UPI0023D9D79B|nr:LOW QUALITY PROTEIN: U2 snRNP-associated SURP motif-containing protein-like [Oppia nitens]